MTTIKDVLKAFKCAVCKDETDINNLELFAEFDPETKKVKFYIYCEKCKTAQGVEIKKPARIQDYLLVPTVGAG